MENKGAVAFGTAGGALVLVAQTKRDDAMSNLATWIKPFQDVPHVDATATAVGLLIVILAARMFFKSQPKPDLIPLMPAPPPIVQTSHGQGSPNIVGNVTIHTSPPTRSLTDEDMREIARQIQTEKHRKIEIGATDDNPSMAEARKLQSHLRRLGYDVTENVYVAMSIPRMNTPFRVDSRPYETRVYIEITALL